MPPITTSSRLQGARGQVAGPESARNAWKGAAWGVDPPPPSGSAPNLHGSTCMLGALRPLQPVCRAQPTCPSPAPRPALPGSAHLPQPTCPSPASRPALPGPAHLPQPCTAPRPSGENSSLPPLPPSRLPTAASRFFMPLSSTLSGVSPAAQERRAHVVDAGVWGGVGGREAHRCPSLRLVVKAGHGQGEHLLRTPAFPPQHAERQPQPEPPLRVSRRLSHPCACVAAA